MSEMTYDGEYIYNHTKVWKNTKDRYSFPVDKGMIVYNVRDYIDTRGQKSGYVFNIPDSDEDFWCYYDWAFVKNTEYNKMILSKIDDLSKSINEKQKECSYLIECIKINTDYVDEEIAVESVCKEEVELEKQKEYKFPKNCIEIRPVFYGDFDRYNIRGEYQVRINLWGWTARIVSWMMYFNWKKNYLI